MRRIVCFEGESTEDALLLSSPLVLLQACDFRKHLVLRLLIQSVRNKSPPGSTSITLHVQTRARGPSQHRNIHPIFQIPVRKSYIKTAHALPSPRFSFYSTGRIAFFLFCFITFAMRFSVVSTSLLCLATREAVAEAGSVAGCVQL